MNCTSHSPRLAMLPGTLRHPRRCVSRTRHSPGMNQQTLSAFIWSVADLVAKEKLGINPEPFLLRKSGHSFYNTSPLDLKTLLGDAHHIAQNLYSYVQAFSPAVRDVFERFELHTLIDLHPDRVSNMQMGLVFEELIRKFAEISNETAAEHFTPREVIRLMVNLIFIEDDAILSRPGVVRTIYDPTAGTGGMLSVAGEYLAEHNPQARLTVLSDGSMLFLLHLISKMRPAQEGGCRLGIVLNGSPLFTGGAGSGESEIRRYVLENDLCEAIVGLPTDMFYNTGIAT